MKTTYSKTIEKPAGFLFARWSAGAKAFESALPENQRIIHDPYAHYYSGAVGTKMVAAMARINPAIRKGIVLRARYFDDYSRKCVNEGFQQVVLLGAGYDSRYLRISEFRSIPVYELDLACTQVIKKTLTRRLLGKLPPNVRYVATDFSKDSITTKLAEAGFDCRKRTLFIWEGVTLFLNMEIVSETLGRLAEIRPGNRVIFDFIPPELIDDETDYMGNRQLLHLCASINEPLTFGCDPEKMKALLPTLGFRGIDIVSMRQANLEYSGTDKIEDSYYFATAEVGSQPLLITGSDNGGVS
jgi:methyltransferase (TIGR00027 family)